MILEGAVVLSVPFDEALSRTKDAFAAEGFGTLTQIDLQATLAAKIGKEIGHHVILGVCNPSLAGRALDAEPQIGALLPCNVVVRQEGATVLVEAMDPGIMATLTAADGIRQIAEEARRLVANALERLAA